MDRQFHLIAHRSLDAEKFPFTRLDFVRFYLPRVHVVDQKNPTVRPYTLSHAFKLENI